jgi:hypothetical protein
VAARGGGGEVGDGVSDDAWQRRRYHCWTID